MLTPFQMTVRRLIGRLGEAQGYALAGGAALIVTGVVDRATSDLDFFASSPGEVESVVLAIEAHLGSEGLKVERLRDFEQFGRLLVSSDTDSVQVDLAIDYRCFPARETADGPVLAEEELAADKLLALVGRSEARDYIDVAALVERHGLEEMCRLAADKDLGFRAGHVSWALDAFGRLPREDFDVDDAKFEQLKSLVERWRQQLASVGEIEDYGFGLDL